MANRLTTIKGEGIWGLGGKGEGIRQKKKLKDNSVVTARGKEG